MNMSQAFAASIEHKRYFDPRQPVGFCIYCGQNDSTQLTHEHIAPEGFQGTVELKNASCKECAQKTGYSELRVLKGPLAAAREHFGWYGKRRKNARPETLPLEILRKDWSREKLKVPTQDCPLAFRMPRFPAPRFLKAPHPDDSDFLRKHDYRKVDTAADESFFEAILKADPGRDKVLLDMEVFELSKVLAKIAYGFSVYFLGPHTIRPFVTDIIIAPRDHAPSFLHYVGGAFIADSPIEHLTTTDLGKCVINVEKHDARSIVIARIQLLGPFNMPVYEVVVGEYIPFNGEPKIYVPMEAQPMKNYTQLLSESFSLLPSIKS